MRANITMKNNLNILSYRIIENDSKYTADLLFELIIDGDPICSNLAEIGDNAIPYYDFENKDLPYFRYEYKGVRQYIIAVCVCGNAGCGSETCQIIKEGDYVIFRDFSSGCNLPPDAEFKFSRENYDSIISQIVERVNEYKQANESK